MVPRMHGLKGPRQTQTEALMRQITEEDDNKGEPQHTKSHFVIEWFICNCMVM